MSQPLSTRAPAKINLSLHVLGRKPDGYHELESLVAFAGTGDTLGLEPASMLDLIVEGPTAGLVGGDADNLVLRATRYLQERVPGLKVGRFHLTKRLPVAAGIGGGSSDAAAALRLLAQLNDLQVSDSRVQEAARLTGADVPVCLEPRARMMRGIGERLGPALALPPVFTVIVNPRVPVETPAVFKALGLSPGEALEGPAHPDMRAGSFPELIGELERTRNDLEPPASEIQPIIREALRLFAETRDCRLARMSGSGATVFGLYENCREASQAAKALREARPHWWVKATSLR